MAVRLIRLRYGATCAGCGVELAPKTNAWWDSEARIARCEVCKADSDSDSWSSGDVDMGVVEQPAPPDPGSSAPSVPVSSAGGGSAQREYERRKTNREAAIRARHPRLGGLILALTEDPQSTTAWARGAEGERRVGAVLDAAAAAGTIALHDRRIPHSRANIDHLAVTPSGVWVIDAKRYRGQVAKRDVGGWLSTDVRLFVGRRDCTKLIVAMSRQVDAVRGALGDACADVVVRPVLCFVDAEWGWFAKPFELQGVLVAGPKAVRERLVRVGPNTSERIANIAHILETALPAYQPPNR